MPRKQKTAANRHVAEERREESSLVYTGERIVPQADNCEPNFASRMYQEHIARYLFAGQIVEGKTVLDVGCGVGYGAQRLGALGAASVHAFDLSKDAIHHAQIHYAHPNVKFITNNAESFSFDGKFDVVTCFELIEHVRRPEKVVANIKAALNEDGILIMSTPRALDQKRTHFHEHEFDLDEYVAMLRKNFTTVDIYVENNHFASLVTKSSPSVLRRVECLKDQFSPADADVFIAVATSSKKPLPSFEPALVLDNDAYVTMLERDVEILHKAERDLQDRLVAAERNGKEVAAFKDAEIERLKAEFEALFTRSEQLSTKAWEAERAAADAAAKDAEIKRLTGEYKALFQKSEELSKKLWQAERAAADAAAKDAEIERLIGEYNALFQKSEELSNKLWQEDRGAADAAAKDAEIERLTREYKALFQKSEELSKKLWRAERAAADVASKDAEIEALLQKSKALASDRSKTEQLNGAKDGEIERLTSELNAIAVEKTELEHSLRDLELRHSHLEEEHANLRETVETLRVRAEDAEGRRLEAYEFARVSSDEAHGLRRELDSLKREILDALDRPTATQEAAVDNRHRDIVEAMERLFLGTVATHHIARSPVVDRVREMALQLKRQREELDRLMGELRALQEFQAHAEDWHAQLLRMRKSVSWRITAPLRAAAKPFRQRRAT